MNGLTPGCFCNTDSSSTHTRCTRSLLCREGEREREEGREGGKGGRECEQEEEEGREAENRFYVILYLRFLPTENGGGLSTG